MAVPPNNYLIIDTYEKLTQLKKDYMVNGFPIDKCSVPENVRVGDTVRFVKELEKI